MTKRAENVVSRISKSIDQVFGKRVLNLVLFGSQIKEKDAEDIDLHLLLDTPQPNDLWLLRQLIPESVYTIDFELSYLRDFETKKVWRLKTSGRYMLYPLAYGKILLGSENHYIKLLSKIDPKLIKNDLLVKNKEHLNRVKLDLTRKDIINKQRYIAKYIIRLMSQTMVVTDLDNLKKINLSTKAELIELVKSTELFNQIDFTFLNSLFARRQNSSKDIVLKSTKILDQLDNINWQLQEEYYTT